MAVCPKLIKHSRTSRNVLWTPMLRIMSYGTGQNIPGRPECLWKPKLRIEQCGVAGIFYELLATEQNIPGRPGMFNELLATEQNIPGRPGMFYEQRGRTKHSGTSWSVLYALEQDKTFRDVLQCFVSLGTEQNIPGRPGMFMSFGREQNIPGRPGMFCPARSS